MRGYELLTTPELEVLAAYCSPQYEVPAVTVSPGWHVVGGFYLHATATLRLELIGLVSQSGLTMRARLFDLATNLPVASIAPSISGSVSTTEQRVVSAQAELTGGRTYQIQVEVTGGNAADEFGVVRSVAPTA